MVAVHLHLVLLASTAQAWTLPFFRWMLILVTIIRVLVTLFKAWTLPMLDIITTYVQKLLGSAVALAEPIERSTYQTYIIWVFFNTQNHLEYFQFCAQSRARASKAPLPDVLPQPANWPTGRQGFDWGEFPKIVITKQLTMLLLRSVSFFP